jgi:hypothetical protein
LPHENDGLIITMDNCPYYPGTCEQILKWKPVELNTIDFLFKDPLKLSESLSVMGLYTKDGPNMPLYDLLFLDDE